MINKSLIILLLITLGFNYSSFSQGAKIQRPIIKAFKDADTVYYYLEPADTTGKSKKVNKWVTNNIPTYEFICNCVDLEIKNVMLQGSIERRKIISKKQFKDLGLIDFDSLIDILKADPILQKGGATGRPFDRKPIVVIVETWKEKDDIDPVKDRFYVLMPVYIANRAFEATY